MTQETFEQQLARLEKKLGNTVMSRVGELEEDIRVLPSGSLALDRALGVGGRPRG